MLVTVAICTWNRAKLLDQTLAQMCMLRIPEGVEWELLVVNNNCTDNTDEVVTSYASRLPIRYFVERRQGKSYAANLAVEKTQGELLLWTDDDVLLDEKWLAEYVRAAAAWPDASFFGGRIDPWYECDPPNWFRNHESALLPLRALGPAQRLLKENEYVYGANMAFRLSVMKQYLFDPNLGRVGNAFILGEELDVMRRAWADGHKGVWVPSAVVQHFVPHSRMIRRSVWTYINGLARMGVRMKDKEFSGKMVFGAPRWLYLQYGKALAAYYVQRACFRRDYFPALQRAAVLEGWIAECRHQHRLANVTNEVIESTLEQRSTANV
jgi:glucosyl-dolichyl phosphate glucuronosyltransferase